MPKLHDPDLLLARARLESALAFFKKAQSDIFKEGRAETRLWVSCLSELDDARKYIAIRVKGR